MWARGCVFLACSQRRWDEEVRVSRYERFSKETSRCDESLACVSLPWEPARTERRRGGWGGLAGSIQGEGPGEAEGGQAPCTSSQGSVSW